MRCAYPKCNKSFENGAVIFHSRYGYHCYICQQCAEGELMPNIKITAEVDGKQVSLETISTETFEAIKALKEPKEIPIPVARWATSRYAGGPRLLLKPSKNLHLYSEYIYAIDIKNGTIAVTWKPEEDENRVSSNYMNVQPL